MYYAQSFCLANTVKVLPGSGTHRLRAGRRPQYREKCKRRENTVKLSPNCERQ